MNFACQESCGGKCCTFAWQGDDNSFIFLTKFDQFRLISFLRKSLESFAQLGEFSFTGFIDKPSRQWYLTGDSNGCQFFKDGKCTVYEARPTQCRTFPYWPRNIVDGKFTTDVTNSCPGINLGNSLQADELMKQQIEAEDELRKNLL